MMDLFLFIKGDVIIFSGELVGFLDGLSLIQSFFYNPTTFRMEVTPLELGVSQYSNFFTLSFRVV